MVEVSRWDASWGRMVNNLFLREINVHRCMRSNREEAAASSSSSTQAAVSVAESAAMDYLADLGEAAGEDHQILRRPSEAARRENEGVQVPESDTSQTRRLSTLPFQAEGHRHCVESITNFGASFWRPTRGMGVRSDIAVTLSVTCRSVHAWFHSRYDTDL